MDSFEIAQWADKNGQKEKLFPAEHSEAVSRLYICSSPGHLPVSLATSAKPFHVIAELAQCDSLPT